ncbi:MAG TPA: acyl-[ACP]--phospholipid O-acyltransferase, partial [Thiothrix sp.]|nr:acyl-[ACP]--phospholipid O-acyltransferase [Thiothrix sp.]
TMLSFLVITILLSMMGMDSLHFFWLLAVVVLVGAVYTIYKLPQSLIRFVISRLITSRYRIHVLNFENIPANGGVLLLGNHISWLDWAMVQIACPRKLHFVITKVYYNKWYLKRFLDLFGVVPIGTRASAESLKTVAQLLRDGKAVCLFPEGTISHSGQLNEFKRGYELLAGQVEQTEKPVQIIPFYLHGLWGSRFSHSGSRLRDNSPSNACKGWKRDLIVAFGKAQSIHTTHDELKHHITELSLSAWQHYANALPTIPQQWLYNTKRRLSNELVCEAATGACLNAHRFMVAVFHFAKAIQARSPEHNIGVLLPSTTAGAITNMAVLSLGKTVVNLNYTASEKALQQAVEQAEIRTIYTSKKFLQKLQSRGIDIAEILPYSRLIYLEDVKPTISKAAMAWTAFLVYVLPASVLAWLYLKPVKQHSNESVGAILFSSGSEGTPKGIKLSHKNLAANARQVVDVLNPHDDDKVVSTLPTFHAFGLLATTLMPLSQGIPIICHPDPTDVFNIAKGIARFKATYLFGTSTFFRMYVRNKKVHPLMLSSIRLTIAGAEKLNPDIREAFQHKFNKIILEGYGATETSPVASVNLPDFLNTDDWRIQIGNRYGTVGQALPGTSFRVVDPVTLNRLPTGDDGLILIAGPQVMKGYLNQPAKTADALVELDGFVWYKTGDKGHLDHDGFLTIVDRYSRFAKVAGEMVSLTAVEQTMRGALNQTDLELLAVNLPDSKKGETIIILCVNDPADESESLNQQMIKQALIDNNANPLMHPSQTYFVAAIPKLGSGKTDFAQAKKLALTLSAA